MGYFCTRGEGSPLSPKPKSTATGCFLGSKSTPKAVVLGPTGDQRDSEHPGGRCERQRAAVPQPALQRPHPRGRDISAWLLPLSQGPLRLWLPPQSWPPMHRAVFTPWSLVRVWEGGTSGSYCLRMGRSEVFGVLGEGGGRGGVVLC